MKAVFAVPTAKSVAVLPFSNLSKEEQNAYFADGVQDQILTDLSQIADLKVISRTSVMQYKSGVARNLRKIAEELGVAHVVEGSVQRAANKIRVSAQLIDARADVHLWAQTYDRDLTDVFAIQSEIAKAIADQLQAKLTGSEEQALAVKPTNNPEAYDAYLRGVAFEARSAYPFYIGDLVWKAVGFYEQAVKLDPNFAIAWARLSRAEAFLSRDGVNRVARGEAAKNALDNAQKLEPNSPETLLALGYYQYWVLRDYGAARTSFERVVKILPASSEVSSALGRIAQREGHWGQSVAYHERALSLDPRNLELLMNTAWTYTMLRKFPAVLRLYDRALDLNPNEEIILEKASIYQAQGNLQEAARLLSSLNEQAPNETFGIKIDQLRLERNYGEAIRLLQARLAQFHFAAEDDRAFTQLELAFTQRLAGDVAGAKVTAEQARNTYERLLREHPESWDYAASLSNAYALIGEKDLALKEAERAIMLVPSAKDAIDGPLAEENLALVQTLVGDNSRAISMLTQLLQKPYNRWVYSRTPITPALLRLDPLWDPLRGDPAFQKLCEEKQP
jgi:TolB-like protein/Tfp pilus assembly protein PilF